MKDMVGKVLAVLTVSGILPMAIIYAIETAL